MERHVLEIIGGIFNGVMLGYFYLLKQTAFKGRTLEDWYYDNFMWLEKLADKYQWLRG